MKVNMKKRVGGIALTVLFALVALASVGSMPSAEASITGRRLEVLGPGISFKTPLGRQSTFTKTVKRKTGKTKVIKSGKSKKKNTTKSKKKKNNNSSKKTKVPVQGLSLHNKYRSYHQDTGSLEWSDTIARSAKSWANHLAKDGCSMYHSKSTSYGENLAIGHKNINNAVRDWYNEIYEYDYSNPGFESGTGHFTQIVWKGSKRLGCGSAKCANGRMVYVCQYDPPGNYRGQFSKNVRRIEKLTSSSGGRTFDGAEWEERTKPNGVKIVSGWRPIGRRS